MNENSPERDSMTREEDTRDRYWRLRKELNELYRRQIFGGELERSVKEVLDVMEDAVREGDVVEAYQHQMVLEVLLRQLHR